MSDFTQGPFVRHELTAPDGVKWRVGERVKVLPYRLKGERVQTISGLIPGDWSPAAEDVDSAWFMLDDGWMMRPHLVCKAVT